MRMKLFYTLFCMTVFCLGYVNAQDIKGNFNAAWVKDQKGNGALPGQFIRPGTQPVGWEASNVNQKVFLEKKETLVTQDTNRTGGSGYSVKMENKYVGIESLNMGSNAPGYITLGVPWVFAVSKISDCDGGTIGGISYTQRPDSIIGYYKRSIGNEGAENAIILAYIWKGTSTSTVKTNPNGGLSSNSTTTVQDQDVCILGKKKADSGNAVLIGKAEYSISGSLAGWTRIAVPFNYSTNDTPQKLNIIISAANYSDRKSIKAGNILWVDDVDLVFNAELKSLTIGGSTPVGFNSKTFEYELDGSLWDAQIVAVGYGKSSTTSVTNGNNIKTITVTDNTSSAKKSNTYTLRFRKTEPKEPTITLPNLPVNCYYGSEIAYVPTSNNTLSTINIEVTDPTIVKVENGKMKFLKPGTTTVKVSQKENDQFKAGETSAIITVKPAPLTVRLQDVTIEEGETPVYKFTYEGLTSNDNNIVNNRPGDIFSVLPKAEAYTQSGQKVTSNSPAGTYAIKWVQTPEASNYNITVDSKEKTLTIVEPVYRYITIDKVTGVSINLSWGTNQLKDGNKLQLVITANDNYTLEEMVVKINGETVYPKGNESPSSDRVSLDLGTVNKDLTIEITGVKKKNDSGIVSEDKGIILFTHPGILHIDTDQPVELMVYTISGHKQIHRNVPAGRTSISLTKGFYIVKANQLVKKIVIN